MNLIVQKYGGTSVGSVERIQAIAKRIVEAKIKYDHVVVVVSAMGKTTDALVKMAKDIQGTPDPREYDALVSTGENVSASLVSMAIQALGHKAISLNGSQAGVFTENIYSKAKITKVDTTRMVKELEDGKVLIVTGFQGINDISDITTIGRGGSDTSAVVLAAALGAQECEIFTDVDGVYTTDPRLVEKAAKLEEISYDEMLELASLGARVLHPRSVECAKENNIVLHVRSSFKSDEGTRVKEDCKMEATKTVTGVTINEAQSQVSIRDVSDTPGVASKLFGELANNNVNVDMIVQSAERDQVNSITFTIASDDLSEAKTVTEKVAAELACKGITFDDDVAKVSIVGVGMISRPGVAAKMFNTLGDNGININLISTSEIKVSCVIKRDKARLALELLHTAFGLDQ
jgi:aspartate kinase